MVVLTANSRYEEPNLTIREKVMAQMKPGFITGANAKIKVNGKTAAYATDVSYNIDTVTVPVECFGRYEVLSNEPVAYGCNGSLSVIRYTKQAKASKITSASDNGNAADRIGTSTSFGDHLKPNGMIGSETFDLEVYQKITSAGAATSDSLGVVKIKDCRLTRRGATLNKRGVLVDNYTFVGIIATDMDGNEEASGSGEPDLG